MKQQNAREGRGTPFWLLVAGALWLAVTVALNAGAGTQPAFAQQNNPDSTPHVEATQTPVPIPWGTPGGTPEVCELTP